MGRDCFALSALFCVGLLGSCASVEPGTEEAAILARESQQDMPDYWSAVAARVGDLEMGWVEAFDDPVLMALVAEAQVNNRNLQATAASVDQAWALARQAGAALTPNVALTAGTQSSGLVETGGGATNLNVGLQASWELDVWGRIRSGQQAAVAGAEAAEADYRYAQQSLAAAVARAYFLSIEAERQQQVAAESVQALEETNNIVALQFENGLATAQDVALARSDLASANDTLISTQGGMRDAVRGLEILLGRYPAAELEVGLTLPVTPDPPPAGLPSEILERRPDLIAAERRIAASIDSVDQAQAARLPQISLTGGIGGSSDALSNLLNPANLAWTAASSLLVPIIDGGALDAQVELTEAEQEQAVAAYAQAALTAFGEVETSLDQGQVLSQRRAALEEARHESEEALRLARLRFEEGESDLLDVLTIQRRVFAAQSNVLSVERLQLDQYVDVNLALGGHWQSVE